MEQRNYQPSEDDEALSPYHLSTMLAKDYETEQNRYRPPTTFEEAKHHSPFYLLTELHNHALHIELADINPEQHLAELALAAAVIHWWSRWQPIAIHRALDNGAHIDEIAKATGLTPAEAYRRWDEWAEVQSNLVIGGRPCVEPQTVLEIREQVSSQLPIPTE